MFEKIIEFLFVLTFISIVFPICFFFWINCVDFVIEKFKEWF